jgi:hypothetical protein
MRRIIYNSSPVSVSNGDQVQMQSNDRGAMLVAQNGAKLVTGVTPVCDTSIYASGDLLFDSTAIAGVSGISGKPVKLTSIIVLDEDDNAAAGLDLYIVGANNTWGTVNSAPTITDALARDIQGHIAVASGDFKDIGGSKIACIENIGIICQPASGSTTLYVAGVTGGTPTQTASGLKLKFGFEAV